MLKPIETPVVPKASELVDELGLLHEQLRPLEALRKRADEVRAKLLDTQGFWDVATERTIPGNHYLATISKRGTVRNCNVAKLQKFLGIQKFLNLCTVSLTHLEKTMGGDEIAKYVIETQNGPRRVTTEKLLKVAA